MIYQDDIPTPLLGKFDIQGAQIRKENRKSNLKAKMLHEGWNHREIWRFPGPIVEFIYNLVY